MAELTDQERVTLLAARLGLPEGTLRADVALQALRHGSYVHERRLAGESMGSNERLEFLGDAVLGLAVSMRCFERFPDAAEGDLTRLRASIVKAESLAQVARDLCLGELLLLGRGEERTGGREKQSLLADALDRLLAPLCEAANAGSLGRDYKTELQEKLQGTHRAAPVYQVLDAPGPQHARTFEVEVQFQGIALGRGSGRTKKEAEQSAAKSALDTGLPDGGAA